MLNKVLEDYRALYEEAKSGVQEQPDRSVTEADILSQLKSIVTIDIAKAKERKAKQIVNALCSGHGNSDDTGQLCFAGFGSWNWEPDRLLRSSDGRIVEQRKSVLEFKLSDLQRSQRNTERSQQSTRRKAHESHVFTSYTLAKIEAGVKRNEITWEQCVQDLGVLDPLRKHTAPVDGDDEGDDGE